MLVLLAAIPAAALIGLIGVPAADRIGRSVAEAMHGSEARKKAGGAAMAGQDIAGHETLVKIERMYCFDDQSVIVTPFEQTMLQAMELQDYESDEGKAFLARIWHSQSERRARYEE